MLSYIQNHLALEPYEVWIKLKEGASSKVVYDDLIKKEVPFEETCRCQSAADPFQKRSVPAGDQRRHDARLRHFHADQLLRLPLVLGAHLVGKDAAVRHFAGDGHLVPANHRHAAQRAGCSHRWRRYCIGVVIGNTESATVRAAIPAVVQCVEQAPPFEIVRQLSDYVQLYGVVGFMLTIGLAVLGIRVSRMKITQALKLGEE